MARVWWTLALVSSLGGAVAWSGAASAQSVEPQKPASEAATKKKAAKKDSKESSADGAAKEAKAPAKRDAADVQKALDAAQKSLDAGKADLAVNQMNGLISGGGLDTRGMARALALRGHAYKKQGKSAQAISDLQSALYLKGGLSEAERGAALQVRAEAYREAGLGDPPATSGSKGAAPAAAKAASASVAPGALPQSSPIATAAVAPPRPEPPAAQQSSGGVGNFFTNLFGGSSAKQAPSPVRAPAEPAVSSWSDSTAKSSGKSAAAPATKAAVAAATPVAPPAVAPSPAGKADGKFRLLLEAVRSRAEAQALGDKVRKQHKALVGEREFDITEAAFGNMGTFYRVRIGPYAEAAETKSVCAAIRAAGVDCQPVAN